MNDRTYEGIDKDPKGAMNPTGNIIRDAWVFGLIPESETCEGWNPGAVQALYEKVSAAWQPFAHLPSRLPAMISRTSAVRPTPCCPRGARARSAAPS